MNLTLHLNSEVEAKLRAQAALTGKNLEELALEALEERLADSPAEIDTSSAGPELSADEWRAQFDLWIGQQQSRNPRLDDSRESIYADRD